MKMFLKSPSTSFTRAFNTAGASQCPSGVLKAVQSGHLRAEAMIRVIGDTGSIANGRTIWLCWAGSIKGHATVNTPH